MIRRSLAPTTILLIFLTSTGPFAAECRYVDPHKPAGYRAWCRLTDGKHVNNTDGTDRGTLQIDTGPSATPPVVIAMEGVPQDICFDSQGHQAPCNPTFEPPPPPAPDPIAILINEGNAYYNAGNYDAAIAKYQEALKIDPSNAEAARNLADARAAKLRTRLYNLNSEGNAFYNAGNYDAAIAKYQEALAADPNNAVAARNLRNARSAKANQEGNAFYDTKNYDAAIAKYQEALAIDPSNEAAQSNLKNVRSDKANQEGGALYDAKDYGGAIAKFEEALAANPANTAAAENLKLARSAKARVDEERRREQQRQEERKREIAQNFDVARQSEVGQNYATARRAYQAILRTDPNNLEARQGLDRSEKLDSAEAREARLLSTGPNTLALDFDGASPLVDFTPNVVSALRGVKESVTDQTRDMAASPLGYVSLGSLADRERALFGEIKHNTEDYLNRLRNILNVTAECVAHGKDCDQAGDNDTKLQHDYADSTQQLAAWWIYWSARPGFDMTQEENARDHWERHKRMFPQFKDEEQYAEESVKFVTNPPPGVERAVRPWSGERLFYNPADHTFAIQNSGGEILTFQRYNLRPKDIRYMEGLWKFETKTIELWKDAFGP